MDIEPAFVEALFFFSLIVVAPVFWKLSRIFTRYLLNYYFSDAEIVITYKCDGKVVGRKRIKTTGYVVDQLKALQGGENGCGS